MLLSSIAIILYDIGSTVLPKTRQEGARFQTKGIAITEDEVTALSKKIRRGLQRPSGLRALQREAAQTIVQAALAARGLSAARIPKSQPEFVNKVLKDQELVQFVEEFDHDVRVLMPRGRMLAEFNRIVTILEKAESELK
jgi:hypothetical protein